MHFRTAAALVAMAFGLNAVDAHMLMNSPTPFNKGSLNNSPLDASGSDFPCKAQGSYDASGGSTEMAQGSAQTVSFTGSAVHGGGSCQLSVTYDKNPTKSSTFKVIHSVIGGCLVGDSGVTGNFASNPNGNQATPIQFEIPSNLPAGEATFAWTWFNKVGNREMYMNCAPITITGSGGDQAAYDALPDMFVANIGGSCTLTQEANLEFPNPGTAVQRSGSGETVPPPAGCGSSSGSTGGSGSDSGSGSNAGSGSDSGQASPSPTSTPTSVAARPSNTGGIFVPNIPSNSEPEPVPTTLATQPAVSKPTDTAAAPPTTGTPSSNTADGQTGPCSTEGAFICLPGGKRFQTCASGSWSVVMQMAAGTRCAMQSAYPEVDSGTDSKADAGAGTGTESGSGADASAGAGSGNGYKHKRHVRFSHGRLRARQLS